MIIWVAELSKEAVGAENVFIATDDERIAYIVKAAGYQAIMTASDALTGTDRIAEAASHIEADIYVNVQGDEPLVDPDDITKIINAKKQTPEQIINGFSWIGEHEDVNNKNIPKVITNENNQMIYMSRNPLPGFKDIKHEPVHYKKQVCIYAFTLQELKAFKDFGRKSELERYEDIEILRFLELDKRVRLIETKPGSLAVDSPEDVAKVEEALAKKHD